MSTESHPSPTGSSSSSLFGGGGSAGASEPLTQPSPAKPTWAQILNSNPTNSSSAATNAASHHSGTSAPTKTKAVSPSASGANNNNNPNSRSGPMSNIYEHQQQQQQSPMNWPLNFNRSSPWMNEDDSQRHPNPSQPSMDNDRQTGGDAFDQLDSSSPTSEWNKPVSSSNSNGWSNFAPQHPSRSNANNNNSSSSSATGNQWLEMNNFYGGTTSTSSANSGNSFNFSQHTNETTSNAGNTWQDPSAGNAAETLPSSSNNALLSKHKTSSTTSSMSGALKGGNAGGSAAAADLLRDPNEPMVPYVPQPKLVEQLGWDEPEIQVIKRPNFDDGTSIWGDPMESAAVPVKKWTNGTKGALTNATNTIQQQSTPPPSTPVNPPISASQPLVAKPVSSGNAPSQMVLNDENWPKQQSPTLGQPSSSSLQWNDSSMLEQSNLSQQMNYRNQTNNSNNWNPPSQQQGNQSSGDWINEGMVDTSSWGLQGAPHKTPFDPYDGMVDTSGWGVQGPPGGMPGGMPPMSRNRFANEFNPNEDLHHARMPAPYENPSFNDPYRQPSDAKSSMMGLGNLLPSNPHSFVPRPGPLYPPPPSSENILRPSNHNGGLSTPPGAMMGHSNPLSPKLVNSSPIPNQVPYAGGMPGKSSSMGNQTPTPSQQQLSGNAGGNNPNGNNNGAVHAQIMQQFRLAVQAGLISQDLLNTKLPPYMLQLLQKLFELQQKFQNFSLQLSELNKQKGRFPLTVFQNEYDQLSKSIDQKKQEMLTVQKEIQDAHNKLKQQPGNSNASQLMNNNNNRPNTGGGDQSRLHKWTKPANPSGQRPSMFPPPPGLTPKDWQTDSHDSNDNWDPSQTNESNPNNQMGHNSDSQIHHHHHHQHQQHHHQQHQHQSSYADPFSSIVDDIDGPPPFIPGQLWNWKASMPNAEEDPHVTPGSFTIGPKGLSSPMGNLNVGGVDSAFSNPSLMHQYPRHQQSSRSQWQQGSLHDQQGFPPSMNDWNKPPQQQQQFRGTSKPPHPSFGGGGYRPYT